MFQRSSFCTGDACVEVDLDGEGVQIRSTRGGPVVAFDREEWAAFVTGARAGEFDLPE